MPKRKYPESYSFGESHKKYRPSLFAKYGAAAGAARLAPGAYDIFSTIAELAPNVEAMFVGAVEAEGLASAITTGAAIGTGGAVLAAAGAGYLIGSAIDSMFTQTEIESIQSLMPGTYQGKFQLSAKKAFKGLRDQYQKNGAVYIVENFGAVADPDLIYIGHSTWNQECVLKAVGCAILRKLFKYGCRIDPQTIYEVLSLTAIDTSAADVFQIIVEVRTANGTPAVFTNQIPANSSLDTLNTLCLNGIIVSQLKDNNPSIIQKIYLYRGTHLLHQMDFEKEVLHLAMSSHMVIQNRTKSAATGSTSTDLIDTQPLKGPVYEFSIGVPKMKADTPIALNSMENQGIVLVRTAQFGGTDVTAYKEPPVRKLFQNCIKSGYVRLNPGALKSMTIGSDIKGYINNVIYKLRFNTQDTQTKQCYGKSQLACFEEELNSGSANNITVNYECQHVAGASLITTKNLNMQPGYSAAAINNVPA